MNIIAMLYALGDKAEWCAYRSAPVRAFLLFIFRPAELFIRRYLFRCLEDVYGYIPSEVSDIVWSLVSLRVHDNAEDAMRIAALFEIYASTLERLPQEYFVEKGIYPPDPLAFVLLADAFDLRAGLADRSVGELLAALNLLRPEVRGSAPTIAVVLAPAGSVPATS